MQNMSSCPIIRDHVGVSERFSPGNGVHLLPGKCVYETQGAVGATLSQGFAQRTETRVQSTASNTMEEVAHVQGESELLLVGWMGLQPACMHVFSAAERLAWQRTTARYLSISPCSSISSATSSHLQRCEEARDHYGNPTPTPNKVRRS